MRKLTILLVLAAILVAGWLYVFKPYITLAEVRASDKPVEIKTVLVNVTGEPTCAKLYVLDHMSNNKPVAGKEPVFLALPDDMPSPDDGELAYTDNVFVLSGYRYQWTEKNGITGVSKSTPSHRFDVVSWQVMTPYKKWNTEPSSDGTVGSTEATKPVSHQSSGADQSSSQFVKGNYIDCLK